jgi:hypothetical protein
MKFIDIAIPNFGDDDEKPDGVMTPIAATPTATAFGRRLVEEYTLDDPTDRRSNASQAGDTSIASIDDKGTDDFFEANDDQTDVSSTTCIQANAPVNASRAAKGLIRVLLLRRQAASVTLPFDISDH